MAKSKSKKVRKGKRLSLIKRAHKAIRTPCPNCKKSHTKNVDRFHGGGSFCKTHKTTKIGRQYCKQTKSKSKKS